MNLIHLGLGRTWEAPQAREAVREAAQPKRIRVEGLNAFYEAREARLCEEEENARQLDRMIGSPVRYGPVRFVDRAMSQCGYILASGLCCGERTARGSWCHKHYDATHVRRAG